MTGIPSITYWSRTLSRVTGSILLTVKFFDLHLLPYCVGLEVWSHLNWTSTVLPHNSCGSSRYLVVLSAITLKNNFWRIVSPSILVNQLYQVHMGRWEKTSRGPKKTLKYLSRYLLIDIRNRRLTLHQPGRARSSMPQNRWPVSWHVQSGMAGQLLLQCLKK